MSSLSDWLPNYKTVYGDFTDPHPMEDSLTADLKFVPKESRNGRTYEIPVEVSKEHGQTADVSGDSFAINPARGSVMKSASVDGATLLFNGRIPYDAMLRTRNGTGNKRQGNAFKDAFEHKTKGVMEQGEFYNEVALHYGCGTAAAIADDIGVITGTPTGTNIGTGSGMIASISLATWAPGVWARMTNALVDIYQSNGSTLVASDVVVSSVNPDYDTTASPPAPNVTFYKSGSSATLASGYRIVPKGWQGNSCIGLISILQNQGTIFGLNAAQYPIWRPVRYTNASGGMTRAKLMAIAARMFPNGVRQGLTFRFSAPTFADLAEETETQHRFNDEYGEVRKIGANKLIYRSPCGPLTVKLDSMMKYGQGVGYGTEAKAVRVGSSPLTFRGKGDEWFFLELPSNAGSEIRCMSNQAPFVHDMNKCVYISGITNTLIA